MIAWCKCVARGCQAEKLTSDPGQKSSILQHGVCTASQLVTSFVVMRRESCGELPLSPSKTALFEVRLFDISSLAQRPVKVSILEDAKDNLQNTCKQPQILSRPRFKSIVESHKVPSLLYSYTSGSSGTLLITKVSRRHMYLQVPIYVRCRLNLVQLS